MNLFELYKDDSTRAELAELLTVAAQQHSGGLPDNFLEKDIWVTEILRLLYEEKLLGDFQVAFKGGTALSKCWGAIERFSEDIDLSIHWADLAESDDEAVDWERSIRNRTQNDKFRKAQTARLTAWSETLTDKLNERFQTYGIPELHAELEPGSSGEKIQIHFPRVTTNDKRYQLDYVLLEFGGRNRGRPTQAKAITTYISEVDSLKEVTLPTADVQVYRPDYILWEKLTALHQFCTQEKDPAPDRLARHWYDVDCLLNQRFADPLTTQEAMGDVISMKQHRWAQRGVDFMAVTQGRLRLIPTGDRKDAIAKDHDTSIVGGMFFNTPDNFTTILLRLEQHQDSINQNNVIPELKKNLRVIQSGAWYQGVTTYNSKTFHSDMSQSDDIDTLLESITIKVLGVNSLME